MEFFCQYNGFCLAGVELAFQLFEQRAVIHSAGLDKILKTRNSCETAGWSDVVPSVLPSVHGQAGGLSYFRRGARNVRVRLKTGFSSVWLRSAQK